MIRIASRTDLAKLIPPGGIGAELGVFCGKFSAKLLKHARPQKLFLVDRWSDGPDFLGDGKHNAEQALQKTRDRTAGTVAEIVQDDVLHWLSTLGDGTLDWIYLDDTHHGFWPGGHLHTELRWSLDKLKDGGWLMGHDYCCAIPQVVWAVNNFCEELGQEIHYLTREKKRRVWPRLPWQPKRCAYESFAIIVKKPTAPPSRPE
jgi:hypothetical protein